MHAKRWLRSLALAAGISLLLVPPQAARAFARFDFEQPYLTLPGRYVKDHAFIQRGDEWHVFLITGSDSSVTWKLPGNEVSFAHASTKDFRHWTLHPDVCSIGTGTWDERNIWAPDVIPWRGEYRMYYTGVDSGLAQQMGLAVSDDLFHWRPAAANPLYHPDTTWADWSAKRWSNCRDPDVTVAGDTLFAVQTCSTRDGLGAVDLAASSDGISWRDRGPILVNDVDSVLESVQLVRGPAEWHLLFSEQGVPGISALRAPGLTGPWNHATRRVVAPGQAAEIFGDRSQPLISRCSGYTNEMGRRRYVLRVDSLRWDMAENPVVAKGDALWRDWSPIRLDDPAPRFGSAGFEIFQTDSAFAYQPTFGENPSLRGEHVVIGATGNSWIGTKEGWQGPLGLGIPGGMVGESAVGAIRSRDFRISGTSLSFWIGGGRDPERLFLALRDARSHAILARETGSGGETLVPRFWRTDSLYGRLVYLEIVDASRTGHLNLDEIVESGMPEPPADAPFPGRLFKPTPNPFRAGTRATVRIDRETPLTIDIFDAAGRLVRRLYSGDAGVGLLHFTWDGSCESGAAAAAGVYYLRAGAGGPVRTAKIVRIR